jgi:hypothetical protein
MRDSKKLENPRDVRVMIIYDYESDDIRVLSGFENPNHTVKLIQLGLEMFLNTIESLNCPSCDAKVHPKWSNCSSCGQEL